MGWSEERGLRVQTICDGNDGRLKRRVHILTADRQNWDQNFKTLGNAVDPLVRPYGSLYDVRSHVWGEASMILEYEA